MKKKYTIEEYVNIAKYDIYLYLIITSIFIAIIIIGSEPLKYISGIFGLILASRSIEKIKVYSNLKKIYTYLKDNNLLDKIGDINYYNESNYFLTDNYMIIYQHKNVYHFMYEEIKCIRHEHNFRIGDNSKQTSYLYITLKNDEEFKILISSTILVNENFKDISNDLINKNKSIIIEEESTIINNKKISKKNKSIWYNY